MKQNPPVQITWSIDHQLTIYRDWDINYSFKQQYEKALKYYIKSLDIKDDDIRTLLNRSMSNNEIALCESALNDAVASLALKKMNHPVNLQVCNCQFEQKVELSNKARKFRWKQANYHGVKKNQGRYIGHKEKPFLHRLNISLIEVVRSRVSSIIPLSKCFSPTGGGSTSPYSEAGVRRRRNETLYGKQTVERDNSDLSESEVDEGDEGDDEGGEDTDEGDENTDEGAQDIEKKRHCVDLTEVCKYLRSRCTFSL